MLAAASPPLPTPAPTLTSAYGAVLAPRATTDLYGYDAGCYNIDGLLSCANIISGCYGDILKATDYEAAATSCFCASGMPYLNCYFNALSTSNCYESILGTLDWNSYMVDYFESTCGSIPPTAMAQMAPPATVSLSFETVKIVTVTGQLQPPPSVAPPNYKGTGHLLTGDCTATDFTLVDAGSTVYFAGFNGCNGDRPECCPWSVAASTESPPTTADARGTNADMVNRIGFDFPQPVDKNQAVLANCADDYYSISGGCCPVGYWLFTTDVGGQTPCYSSINRVATPPTLTAGLAGNPTDTSKPTSAVVNIVWSMRYPVADPGGSLSTAAKAGIGAGAGVAAILIGVLAICLWKTKRKNKRLESQKAVNSTQDPTLQQTPQTFHQAATPNGPFLQHPPGMLAPSLPDPSGRGSIMTNTTISAPSPLIPQTTGASNGGASELSTQSSQGLLQNGSYFAGSPGPGTNNSAYPAPIAEVDEAQGQGQSLQLQQQPQPGYSPYGYPQQPPQPSAPQPGQFYPTPGQQPHFYPAQGPPMPPLQGQQPFYGMPPQQYPLQGQQMMHPPGQHVYYGAIPQSGYQPQSQPPPSQQQMGMPEMSTHREVDPPQEVMGSHVR